MQPIRTSTLVMIAILALSSCSGADDSMPPLSEPLQINVEPVSISPGMVRLAEFSANVLVLAKRDYPTDPSDILSGASPLDLAVAWGPAASDASRRAVELTQSDRQYHWRSRKSDAHIPGVGDFTRHSGNWHIVPADAGIADRLKEIRPDDIVSMEGDLILLTFPDGTYYSSSLVRDDVGLGACEIFRVTSLSITRKQDV